MHRRRCRPVVAVTAAAGARVSASACRPIMKVEVMVPHEFQGVAIALMNKRKGECGDASAQAAAAHGHGRCHAPQSLAHTRPSPPPTNFSARAHYACIYRSPASCACVCRPADGHGCAGHGRRHRGGRAAQPDVRVQHGPAQRHAGQGCAAAPFVRVVVARARHAVSYVVGASWSHCSAGWLQASSRWSTSSTSSCRAMCARSSSASTRPRRRRRRSKPQPTSPCAAAGRSGTADPPPPPPQQLLRCSLAFQ